MNKILTIGILIFISGISCQSWTTTTQATLATTYQAAKQLSSVVEPHYREKCRAVAQRCSDEANKACVQLVQCQAERSRVNKVIIAIHAAIAAGYSFIALKDEKNASITIIKASAMLKNINDSLIKAGMYK